MIDILEKNEVLKITRNPEDIFPFKLQYENILSGLTTTLPITEDEIDELIEYINTQALKKAKASETACKISNHMLIMFETKILDGIVKERNLIDPITLQLELELLKVLEVSKIATFFSENVKITIEAIE